MSLPDLPEDVLSIIQAHLEPSDYLKLCRTSKALYSRYRQDPFYWRTITANTFRLPVSPLLAADGPRWYWLYKRLKTHTRLYTWGQGLNGNLGPGRALPHIPRRPPQHPQFPRNPIPRLPLRTPPRQIFQRTSSSWPTEAHVPDEVGIIADLQCSGWSTTILSADGKLYTTGSLDSLNGITIGETTDGFEQLQYLTQSTSAIRSFSAGRRHILALSDDGEILSWDRINAKGLKVFSRSGRDFGGRPSRVAAGWVESSAYIPEAGIVYWSPIKNDQSDDQLDGVHVKEKIIPGTAHQSSERGHFEVTKHIILEGFIVWITSDSKLFACEIGGESPDQLEPTNIPFEVPGYAAQGRELKDIQGQFRNFGVFTITGDVLAGNIEYIQRCREVLRRNSSLDLSDESLSQNDLLAHRPPNLPFLQQTGVIALAYGDHHYHALHADGKITTWGTDSQSCGALGLGGSETGARFRGLKRGPNPGSPDARLVPAAESRGRQIWFEPEKKDWLQWLEDTSRRPQFTHEDQPAIRAWQDHPERQAAFSEWVEQEGRHWSAGPDSSSMTTTTQSASGQSQLQPSTSKPKAETADYENLDPYFAIAITAAGWHSGTLVLVDEDKALAIRDKWITIDHEGASKTVPGQFESTAPDEEYVWKAQGFPKVRLPDGYEMPGEGEVRRWRDGVPTTQELGLA